MLKDTIKYYSIPSVPRGLEGVKTRPQNAPPPDPSGGSPSAPEETSEVGEVDVKRVREIKPALANYSKREVVKLLEDTIKAVGDVVANGYRREGARERSFMYSLGVYIVPLDTMEEEHKYFCLATAGCRQKM